MDSLNGIIAFVRAAEHLSFVAAARSLGISPSAVGKSIARLEHNAGVRLFQRSTRRMQLTAEGEMFFQRCRRVLDDLQEAQASLARAQDAPRGRLRISTPTIGYRFLVPHLGEFRARYPEIELEIDFSDRIVDVIDEGIDVAIRSGELPDSRLMARRLGGFRFFLCASPAYLKARGAPRSIAALQEHDAVLYRLHTTGKLMDWTITADPRWMKLRFARTMTLNNMEAVLHALEAGHGIGFMPDFLVRDALAAGRLKCVLEAQTTERGQFWAVWAANRQLSPKVRVLVDHIATRLFEQDH
ncbi:LysR substrate-binding domain-containing protein [Herbaspirillum chlorophenolicum]|uniref:LysR substrate-binding domain-containing protein n=1 Tax=Herbaspirillum chlorophenolicum TaxID=211589 RepID=UPI00067A7A01|nr:LysR substrate-binding domain-containing protein [Herbaspirillum chlorophenolicum]